MPRRRRSSSTIWSPTVYTGSSAVCGSWNSIAIRAPRTSRMSASSSSKRLTSPSIARPPVMCAGGESKIRSTARACTVLPEPDSPSTARISPLPSSYVTPSTALTTPSSVWNSTCRSSTVRTGSAIATEELRVHGVTQRLAEQDERADQQAQEQRRPEHQVRVLGEPRVGDGELQPPRDRRQSQADAEERQARLGADRAADDVRGEHEHRRDPVRQDVATEDPSAAGAHRARRAHVPT